MLRNFKVAVAVRRGLSLYRHKVVKCLIKPNPRTRMDRKRPEWQGTPHYHRKIFLLKCENIYRTPGLLLQWGAWDRLKRKLHFFVYTLFNFPRKYYENLWYIFFSHLFYFRRCLRTWRMLPLKIALRGNHLKCHHGNKFWSLTSIRVFQYGDDTGGQP